METEITNYLAAESAETAIIFDSIEHCDDDINEFNEWVYQHQKELETEVAYGN